MKTYLLAGAAFGALMALALPAGAEDLAATADAGAEVSELVVYGRGETRQIQAIQQQEIERAAPGTSPIKLVSKLPGVNFQSADALGAYEWSTRISIRGFNQNQLGFTLDDVPLGDMSYGNHNGLHISRAIASENIGQVLLAQGSGALETASTSNLGGTLKFVSRDPADEMGALASASYGNNNTWRAFVRLETGELPTGARAYVSYARQHADKWKGDGEQKQEQINARFVQPVGPGELSGFVNWSKRRENDYQDLSLEMISRLGYDWDNISDDWAKIINIADIANNRGETGAPISNAAAGVVYPGLIKTVDDAYANASGLRDDTLWGLSFRLPFGETFEFKATTYGHTNEGQGLWYTPYVPSPGGGPISIRTTEYDIDRKGVILGGAYTAGAHRLQGGFWYEKNDFNQARRFYGLGRTAPGRDSLEFQRGAFFTQWEYAFETETTQFHLQDTWTVNEALKVNFGAKAVKVTNTGATIIGATKNGTIEAEDNFLPQVSATYRLSEGSELFGGYAENMRAFVSAGTAGPFSTTQAGFDAIKGALKPETSRTIELGWRFQTGPVQGVVAAYLVKFENRLLATSSGAGIVGNPSVLSNVGSVETKGIEAAGTWSINPDWSLFGSYALTDSSYQDDVRDGSGVVTARTAGKTPPDTPEHLAHVELAYDNGSAFAKLGATYTGERYYTYLNDASVPSTTILELSAGYRFPDEGLTKGLELQLNVSNLLDEEYVSTIGSNGFSNSDLTGTGQTLLAGAPRQVMVTVRKAF
jgi:iron complex outermembrane receptor protein